MVIGTLSRSTAGRFYAEASRQQIMIVQSHQQVSETLTRGERLIAAEGRPHQLRVARPEGRHKIQTILVRRTARSPSARRPFRHQGRAPSQRGQGAGRVHDQRTRVQKLLPARDLRRPRSDVEPPAGNPPLAPDQADAIGLRARSKRTRRCLKTRFNRASTSRTRRGRPRRPLGQPGSAGSRSARRSRP